MDTPNTLQEAIIYFSDPDRAFQCALNLRFPNGVVSCPRCGSEKHSFIKTRRIWMCYGCNKQFSLKVGTIFEDSALGLDKWMCAYWLLCNSKNGISSCELARSIGVTQKSAWHMLHRIRKTLHGNNIPDSANMVCSDVVRRNAGRGIYPETLEGEEDMTLCIAAECMYEDKRAIVLCRDWQANKGTLITSDDADKLRDIDEAGKMCRVLIAGEPTRADQLLTACTPHVRKFLRETSPEDTDLHIDALLNGLRWSAQALRKTLVDHWVHMTLNMSFDDFRKTGRNELLESHYHDIWDTIKRFDIGAILLFALFDAAKEPVLIRLDGNGEPHWESDYSTIGSGSAIAQAFLCQVEWDGTEMSCGDCIYETMRAKFAAERSRDVGKGTSVNVMVEGTQQFAISPKGFGYYENKLNPYKTPKLKFDASFLELDPDVTPASDAAYHGEDEV